MTPAVGRDYLCGPFTWHDGHRGTGGFRVRVRHLLPGGTRCIAQHLRHEHGQWLPGMSTALPVAALSELPVVATEQLALFAVGGAR